ncbi:MAG: SH3 domain-containing protein [Deltaproteobacteria bacterium]|nr:SH3 domain-containing protein [Deltaproteobacteria bacterium]
MLSTNFCPRRSVFKESIFLRRTAAYRYVPANSTYRIRCKVYSYLILILFLFLFSLPVKAEEFSGGSAAELSSGTVLLRGAQKDAEVIGRLPKGTVLTILGESEGGWVKVEVELVDGVEQGWIDESAIKGAEQQELDDNRSQAKKKKKKNKKRSRLPEDELAVIKRDPSFTYGVYAGGNFGILSPAYDEVTLQGMGGQGGAFIYWYLSRESSLGVELGVTQLSGSESQPIDSLSVKSGVARLFDVSAVFEYLYQNFRFFGVLQYSKGIGISDFPLDQVESASDFSGLWFKAGAGYSIPLSDVVSLVGKGTYGYSFNRAYVGFQGFFFSAYLEFRG